MAAGGVLGNGCKVAYSVVESPATWVPIPELIDMGIPTLVADRVDSTVHSTTSNLKKSMPGMQTVGDPWFTVVQDLNPVTSAAQAALRGYQAAGTTISFRMEVPVTRAKDSFLGYEFEAAVANYEPAVPIGDRQTTKFTLMFDGDSIRTDAAVGASQIT
jgi:hypothetical protein